MGSYIFCNFPTKRKATKVSKLTLPSWMSVMKTVKLQNVVIKKGGLWSQTDLVRILSLPQNSYVAVLLILTSVSSTMRCELQYLPYKAIIITKWKNSRVINKYYFIMPILLQPVPVIKISAIDMKYFIYEISFGKKY
jgi:hypothetical protein